MPDSSLVSVVVITYNSAQYVLDTLESIKAQTYQNIELIISDDCSTDETLSICKEWIERNHSCLIQTRLLATEINTGIPANCNRGIKEAQGEWIKLIAGDDILLPSCIEDNITHVLEHKNIDILFSKMESFQVKDGKKIFDTIYPKEEEASQIYNLPPLEQLKILLKNNIGIIPTLFMSKVLTDKYKYNETYRYLEDIPFLIKLTSNGVKLNYMDKLTVLYRISDSSISCSSKKTLYPSRMYESSIAFYYLERKKLMQKYAPHLIKDFEKRYLLWHICEIYLNNKATRLNRLIYKILHKIL